MIIINIPKFKNDEEAADFWDNRSFEDYVEGTKEAEIEFVRITGETLKIRLKPGQ